jgi:hypothetical protein
MIQMINTREIWNNQSLSGGNEVLVRERIVDVAGLECYIGMINVSKARVFILKIDENVIIQPNYLKRFVGVEIQILPGLHGRELIIILLDNELSDIFSYFIEDIISAISEETDCLKALQQISVKVSYWKRLFSKITGSVLTPQQQRGLYGELFFLNDLLDSIADQSFVINGWHGPSGANQDFWYNGLAIEIKTSKANKPSIKISNEYQLDNGNLNNLFLVFYRISEFQGGRDTLMELINQIRNKLLADNLEQFNDKLISLGISPESESEDYNSRAFNINSEKVFQITEDFPRITRSTLDDAISAVTYEIEPLMCSGFETDIDTLFNTIKDGSN